MAIPVDATWIGTHTATLQTDAFQTVGQGSEDLKGSMTMDRFEDIALFVVVMTAKITAALMLG